jgi:hypothetical protein
MRKLVEPNEMYKLAHNLVYESVKITRGRSKGKIMLPSELHNKSIELLILSAHMLKEVLDIEYPS